jgi:hypothetical protein
VRRLDAAFFLCLSILECGGSTPLSFFLSLPFYFGVRRLDAAFFLCLSGTPRRPAGT